MIAADSSKRKIPVAAIAVTSFFAVLLVACWIFLSRPAQANKVNEAASAEAKAYLKNLELADVQMQASENFMKQQVVEIQGKISNHGPRKLSLVEVYCLFAGVNGSEIYRERVTVVRDLAPQETRSFRLPFDSLPDGWNQAMPRLVVAKIAFSS